MKRAVIQTSFISVLLLLSTANMLAAPCETDCNHAPVAESTFFKQINQFTSTTDVLPASDPDSDPLTFTIVQPPVGGTMSAVSSTGEFTYTTIGNFSGTDYILFKVSDGKLESAVATATIQVDYINRAPTVSNVNLTAPQDEPFVFDKGLQGEDLDSDPLIYTIVFTTSHGVLSDFDNTNGNFIYTPDSGFVGTDVFTFKANDGTVDSNLATGTINFVLNNKPHLTILGDNPFLLVTGTSFTDPGATATDTEDGVLTGSITTNTDLDSNIPGTYSFVYSVADLFGVTTHATRTIVVYDIVDDIDGDGIMNSLDPDIDGDGQVNNIDADMDGDGLPNSTDTDDDEDGLLDGVDPSPSGLNAYDFDNDKVLNEVDFDLDGDGIINHFDNDVDGDGLPNSADADDDNDGLLDESDSSPRGYGSANDFDGDSVLNVNDTDMDGDGLQNDADPDMDGDGILNGVDTDLDGDGTLNSLDADMDGDGILNNVDTDTDGDGILNESDTDDDSDGILDVSDTTPNSYVSSESVEPVTKDTKTQTGGGFVIPNPNPTGLVLGTSTSCGVYLNLGSDFLVRGHKNNIQKVILLKKFLNKELGLNLRINGYFGPLTEDAVKKFQLKYKDKILTPWGIDQPTGVVYLTTASYINYLECPALGYTVPIEALKPLQ